VTGAENVDAFVAAAQTLSLLGIDENRPVDPFAAIDRLGLDLVIADLDNLLGAVLPQGNGGVLVTSRRGVGVQRYTAAHEIGHWILHREMTMMDGQDDILGRPSTARERQAQLFAAYFLMPPPLIEAAVTRYDVRSGQVIPEQVYLISRDVNVSYEAAARRLARLRLVTEGELERLLRFGRMRALQSAFAGRRPTQGVCDLWEANVHSNRASLAVREGDDVVVILPENRTTGWQWLDDIARRERGNARFPRPAPPLGKSEQSVPTTRPTKVRAADVRAALALLPGEETLDDPQARTMSDPQPLQVVADDFDVVGIPNGPRERQRFRRGIASAAVESSASVDVPVPEKRVGATGQRSIAVHCAEAGAWPFVLHYAHIADPTADDALEFRIEILVDPTPTHAYRLRRLAIDFDERLPGDPDDAEVFEVSAT
jgi:predicted secreted protein